MSGTSFFDYGVDNAATSAAPTFLAEASVDEWAVLIGHCERRSFRRGDVILRAGEIDGSLVIVLDGELETVVERKGRTRRLSPAPAGSVVGELGFLDGRPRSATVSAATDGDLLRLSGASFEALAAANPRLGRMVLFDLGRILAGRLRALTDQVMMR